MSLTVKKGDITRVVCDAVVNPANSLGYMGGGVAGVIKRVGGLEIEKEAVGKAPIRVGSAVATTAGLLPCRFVIHAPTMEQPAMRTDVEKIRKAVRAAFVVAKSLGLKRIAFPGMGTGVGGVETRDAAHVMVEVAREYLGDFDEIVFVDVNEDMVNAWRKEVSGL
ncbi:MAG TPA: macro domain-containing protein [Thermoplasmatales archaeon]|nr:macro domain-containing protein [Thermoplasmatales archaeon]